MSTYACTRPVTGTQDLDATTNQRMDNIRSIAQTIALRAGYAPWSTPVIEYANTITRSIGNDTDIVSKEMFRLEGDNDLILRPEGTAPLMRAVLEKTRGQQLPLYVQYCGPMFRRENPQAGRYRQFTQFGLEAYGSDSAVSDADIIGTAYDILCALGLGARIALNINCLGTSEERAEWRERAIAYFSANKASLSAESQSRLATNPLRIYDSKDASDQALVSNAPRIILGEASTNRWNTLIAALDAMDIPYIVNPTLIRGLDYYNQTVFEFIAEDGLGAQNTVLAGGRYDQLAERFGYPTMPAIGWAMGMERLAIMLDSSPLDDAPRPIYIVSATTDADITCLGIARKERNNGNAPVIVVTGKRLKRAMAIANRNNAAYVIIIGTEEMSNGTATRQNMDSGEREPYTL